MRRSGLKTTCAHRARQKKRGFCRCCAATRRALMLARAERWSLPEVSVLPPPEDWRALVAQPGAEESRYD